ncbi:hypothetical protein [Tenacibaculum retecalamus]|uniref:hypothetical protein n=1 Tax=Tenacibaculum retecalamus TaxID=3018315 RepID=UPI0023D9529B|nr:hypothetical protein [Tenacibaculum retecalamus]WBX70334.1 hypothetical protein PG912_08575 [Tenacibaculum retecalamus]
MAPYNKHILTLFLTLIFISVKINAQEVRVIDNKGTIQTVNNTRVFTGAINKPSNADAIIGDIYFDQYPNPNSVEIWDGALWKVIKNNTTHTGTSGSVFFADIFGNPTENNSQLFWDDGNNRLGIGTPSPDNKLHVTGAIKSEGILNSDGTVGEPSYRFSDDTDTGIYSPLQDEIGLTVGGIEAIHIDETSNNTTVAINETLELNGKLLDITNSEGTSGQILSSTNTGTNWIDNTKNSVTTNNAAPLFPIENDVWFDTLNSEIKIYDTIDGWKLITSTSASGNIYTTNGTLTTDRTVTGAGLGVALTFSNINGFTLNSINSNIYNAAGSNVFSAGSSTTITSAASNVFTSAAATQLRSTSGIVEIFGATGIDLVSNTNVTGNISVTGTYADSSGDTGTDGQILSSIGAGAGTNWIDPPTIKAMGKIAANGNEIKITTDYTVTKAGLGNGRYQINIPAAMQTNANYIIQLTAFANGNGNDDYIVISYYDQTTANFKVEIKNYNGGRRNKPFMFTILDF